MATFLSGHATHPDWRMATELALAQLDRAREPRIHPLLGLVYASAPFASHFLDIREMLERRLPQVQWSGACTPGVCANDAEYLDEPAVVILLGQLPAGSVHAFGAAWEDSASNAESVAQPGASLLLHADPGASDLVRRLGELGTHVSPGLTFGGIVEPATVIGEPGSAFAHGLSGLSFGPEVRLLSKVTHGCAAVGREHRVTSSEGQALLELDGRPALDVMLEDLQIRLDERDLRDPRKMLRRLRDAPAAQGLLLGLCGSASAPRAGFTEHRMSELLGIDPHSRAIAVADRPAEGERAIFCRRDAQAARTDLIRICTELREELEASALTPLAAHYVSCVARGRRLFGSSGAELALVRHNLGEIPLAGFFAHGEIADARIHGYTGVLTLIV